MIHYSIAHEPVGTDKSFLQDIRVVSFNWDWLANFSRYNIPSSVLVTVQSWISWNTLSQFLIYLC